jgi:hypothetical protein
MLCCNFSVLFDIFGFVGFIGKSGSAGFVGFGGHEVNLLIKIICDLNLKSY